MNLAGERQVSEQKSSAHIAVLERQRSLEKTRRKWMVVIPLALTKQAKKFPSQRAAQVEYRLSSRISMPLFRDRVHKQTQRLCGKFSRSQVAPRLVETK